MVLLEVGPRPTPRTYHEQGKSGCDKRRLSGIVKLSGMGR